MTPIPLIETEDAKGLAIPTAVTAVFLLILGLTPSAMAAEQGTNDQFMVKLTDGSSIVCKPALATLPLKTSFADIQVPMDRVESIKFDQAAKTASVALLNGDRLQGTIGIDGMTVSSALGELKIPLGVVREVATMLKREPVFEDTPERRNHCINNLRQIDAAKEQAALEHRWVNGRPVTSADMRVNAYIKGNATPICPAGGKYTYGPIGENPKCNVPGHELPAP